MTMRIDKRMTAVALALMVTSTLALPASAEADGFGPFADVDGSEHELDVAAVWSEGITTGCDEWLYCPDDEVTRAQMAAFLARALELSAPETAVFSDIEASTFAA